MQHRAVTTRAEEVILPQAVAATTTVEDNIRLRTATIMVTAAATQRRAATMAAVSAVADRTAEAGVALLAAALADPARLKAAGAPRTATDSSDLLLLYTIMLSFLTFCACKLLDLLALYI